MMPTTNTAPRTRATPHAPAAQRRGSMRSRKPRAAAASSMLPHNRETMIAEAAYFRAERRGFLGGPEADLADWLEAEKEIDTQLAIC